MKRNAVPVASALLAVSLLASAAPVLAGDAAEFAPLGFSADGRYFAFEEFGIQDGSGFAYAHVFVLDVAEDRWVGGSPFRVRLEEDGNDVSDARAAVRRSAAATLDRLAVSAPATIVALHGDGEIGNDTSVLEFGRPGYGMADPEAPARLELTTLLLDDSGPCTGYGFDPPVGYALSVTTDGGTSELHRDARVPNSRGCTLAYRLYGVVAPMQWHWNALTPVAIISVYTHGFEGPDRRFVAVPIPLQP